MPILRKKNADLVKDITDLSERVAQLDEDTDIGVKLLRNAHERERKISITLDEYNKKDFDIIEKHSELKSANEELKNELEFVKDKYEKSIRENQESHAAQETKIKDLEEEKVSIKNHSEAIGLKIRC